MQLVHPQNFPKLHPELPLIQTQKLPHQQFYEISPLKFLVQMSSAPNSNIRPLQIQN